MPTLGIKRGYWSGLQPCCFNSGDKSFRYLMDKGLEGHRNGLNAMVKRKIPIPAKNKKHPLRQLGFSTILTEMCFLHENVVSILIWEVNFPFTMSHGKDFE